MPTRKPSQPPPFPPKAPARRYSVAPILFVLAMIGAAVAIWVYADKIPGLLNRGVKKIGDIMPPDIRPEQAPIARQDVNVGVAQMAPPEQQGDPEEIARNAVRRFLKATDNDAEFDEVKWWPPQPLRGSRVCDRWRYERITLPTSVIEFDDAWILASQTAAKCCRGNCFPVRRAKRKTASQIRSETCATRFFCAENGENLWPSRTFHNFPPNSASWPKQSLRRTSLSPSRNPTPPLLNCASTVLNCEQQPPNFRCMSMPRSEKMRYFALCPLLLRNCPPRSVWRSRF